MVGFAYSEENSRVNVIYSYLGRQILSGNTEAVKWIYGNAWKESPPLIETVRMLQECLTSSEIQKNIGKYNNKFLYYWGMLNLGEVSNLIFRDLGTAEICLKKVKKVFPNAEARLAYIKLLKSNEPPKCESNVMRLDTLRRCAAKHDLFSRIVLSKIMFYQFLGEDMEDDSELPIRMYHLLERPCQMGHPVAIRFWNEVLDYTEPSNALEMRINETKIDEEALYDFIHEKCVQICK